MQETQETWIRSLGWQDSLQEEMVTHSSALTRRIPRIAGPGRPQATELQRVGHDWAHSEHTTRRGLDGPGLCHFQTQTFLMQHPSALLPLSTEQATGARRWNYRLKELLPAWISKKMCGPRKLLQPMADFTAVERRALRFEVVCC